MKVCSDQKLKQLPMQECYNPKITCQSVIWVLFFVGFVSNENSVRIVGSVKLVSQVTIYNLSISMVTVTEFFSELGNFNCIPKTIFLSYHKLLEQLSLPTFSISSILKILIQENCAKIVEALKQNFLKDIKYSSEFAHWGLKIF